MEPGYDVLTGLGGRDVLLGRCAAALRETDGVLAVLVLDIDGFRIINDVAGMHAGDAVISALAQRMLGATRRGDTVARVGGDEFALLCPGLRDEEEARMVATRLTWAVERAYDLGGQVTMPLRASVGMVVRAGPEQVPEALLRDAGVALYSAKAAGGGQLVVFTEALGRSTADHSAIRSALREAVDTDGFELHYQALFALPDLRVAGTEALLRWQHAERGWISPVDFVPVAEETGLIVSLGHWVMRTAAAQLVSWLELGRDVTMSINVSARQLAHPDLLFQVREVLSRTGITPSRLTFEVTESQVMRNLNVSLPVMTTLRGFGVRLAIDDFGTGYASLAHLKHIPADELKIDGSFIVDLDSDPRDRGVVKAMIEMSHALGMTVVAEGVETAAQLAILEEFGCDVIQGFLLARPVPAGDVSFDSARPG